MKKGVWMPLKRPFPSLSFLLSPHCIGYLVHEDLLKLLFFYCWNFGLIRDFSVFALKSGAERSTF